MVHMYIVTNTTIILIVRLQLLRYNYMFQPSMLFHLQVVHEALNDKLYLHVSGKFTVCGVGRVQDLVLCLQKGYGSGLFRGVLLKYCSHLLIAMSILGYISDMCHLYWRNCIIMDYIQTAMVQYLQFSCHLTTLLCPRMSHKVKIQLTLCHHKATSDSASKAAPTLNLSTRWQ